ncbi:MAG: 1-acyl-sn-glycerol-3-phosphate acyltransferase [Holosporales bacterium]|nr:1-acyl-sn-glycerol-3-phosphate acyltransferase [Holosporales bacterium]
MKKQGRFRYAVCAVRSSAFYIVLTVTIGTPLLVCWPLVFLSDRVPFFLFSSLSKILIWLMRFVLGIRVRFENVETLRRLQKDYGCFIIAPKHQSELETLIFSIFFKKFRIVYKRETGEIPIIGDYMRRMKFIPIDRSAGSAALKQLLVEGLHSCQMKRPVLIFPEGTRTPFGVRGSYHIGGALMYDAMKVPILPVAHNSGEFFPPHSFVKFPGVITFKIIDPIMPGYSTKEALHELETRIEAECLSHASNVNE